MSAQAEQTSDDDARARVLALLRAHGWNATSFQVLAPGFHYWFDESGSDGCVAYVDTGGAWVAAGAPLADDDALAAVAGRFIAAARAAGRRAVFFGVEDRFLAKSGMRGVRVGAQPVWEPSRWEATLAGSRTLREQLRRARKKGVVIRAVAPDELVEGAPLRATVARLIERWRHRQKMAPMGFLVGLDPFAAREERRFWVAEAPAPEGRRLVGFLALAPIYARQGWFLEEFVRDPDAPNGTMELLVDAVFRAAAEAERPYVTLGLAPLAGDVDAWLRAVRKLSRGLYDFGGLQAWKARFGPARWDPISLALPDGESLPAAILDTLRAFSRVGLLRFGVDTVLRVPAVVVDALAALLVPWTAMLAALDGPRWFPSPVVKWAWVGFDVVLAGGLFALARRFRPWLATLLACAVTGDAALTIVEALVWNAPRARTFADVLGVVLAVLAPTTAAALLWRARSRHTPPAPMALPPAPERI